MDLRKFWTAQDISKLRKFVKRSARVLIPILYQNIFDPRTKTKKPNGFYGQMGIALGKTSLQCKSKFQKFEKLIYTEYLKVPVKDYMVFEAIRSNGSFRLLLTQIKNQSGAGSQPEPRDCQQQKEKSLFGNPAELTGPTDKSNSKSDRANPRQSSQSGHCRDESACSGDSDEKVDLLEHWKSILEKMRSRLHHLRSPREAPGILLFS